MGAEWNKANRAKCAAATRRHYQRNKESKKQYARDQRDRLRRAALARYGNICACCGECDPAFLTIDHIVPAGKRKSEYERKALYAWLKSQGYPDGFQTLCWNCNMAKGAGKVCPHQL